MEKQKELVVLLRQNVNKATTCLDIQKDVLLKPFDTKLDMDQLCMKLSEDSFNKTGNYYNILLKGAIHLKYVYLRCSSFGMLYLVKY